MAQKGISKNAFDARLLLLASQLAYELHDAAQSESYLLSAKEVAEDEEEVLMRLTNLYLEEERYEDVIAFAKEPIDNVLTKWNIAKAYQGLEADKKALAKTQNSCMIMPTFCENLGKKSMRIKWLNII